jgi:hypothetical protein
VLIDGYIGARHFPLQAGEVRGLNYGRPQAELLAQFLCPLVAQMGRAEHQHPADQATVEHFSADHAGLNRLADAHVVSN